jgi:hypothetical protein
VCLLVHVSIPPHTCGCWTCEPTLPSKLSIKYDKWDGQPLCRVAMTRLRLHALSCHNAIFSASIDVCLSPVDIIEQAALCPYKGKDERTPFSVGSMSEMPAPAQGLNALAVAMSQVNSHPKCSKQQCRGTIVSRTSNAAPVAVPPTRTLALFKPVDLQHFRPCWQDTVSPPCKQAIQPTRPWGYKNELERPRVPRVPRCIVKRRSPLASFPSPIKVLFFASRLWVFQQLIQILCISGRTNLSSYAHACHSHTPS